MKRKLWIAAATAILLAVLWCGMALAGTEGSTYTLKGITGKLWKDGNHIMLRISELSWEDAGINNAYWTPVAADRYADPDLQTVLTTEPEKGDSFYCKAEVMRECNPDEGYIDFSQIDLSQVHVTMAGYTVEVLGASGHNPSDYNREIEIYCKITKGDVYTLTGIRDTIMLDTDNEGYLYSYITNAMTHYYWKDIIPKNGVLGWMPWVAKCYTDPNDYNSTITEEPAFGQTMYLRFGLISYNEDVGKDFSQVKIADIDLYLGGYTLQILEYQGNDYMLTIICKATRIDDPATDTVTYEDPVGGEARPYMAYHNNWFVVEECFMFTPPEGYAFYCWKLGDSFYYPGDVITVTEDITLVAQWRKLITVEFNSNGGTGEAEPISMFIGDKLTLPECPFTPPDGYVFAGWKLGSQVLTPGTEIFPNEDKTFTAQWVKICTITFDPKGGTVSPTSAKTGSGGKLQIDLPIPTRDGYQFSYWYRLVDGTVQVVNADTVFSENTTIYAMWSEDYRIKTITFDPKGGTVSPTSAKTGTDGKLKIDLPTPTRDGYQFSYWYRLVNGTAQAVDADTVYTANTTVYAQWSGSYCLITVKDGTADRSAAGMGQTVTITAAERENYTFSSWVVEEGDVTLADAASAATTFVMGTQDVTVRATYAFTGATLTDLYFTVTEPENGACPAAPVPEADACVVQSYEWTDAATGTQLSDTDTFQAGTSYKLSFFIAPSGTPLDQSLTCYINGTSDGVVTEYRHFALARVEKTFTAKGAVVSFDANGGSGTMESVAVNGTYELPECFFTPPEGYGFMGWDCGHPGDTVTVTGDMTVTAQWKQIAGQCGDDVTWHFSMNTGTLTVSGAGAMWYYSSTSPSPFYNDGAITSLVIEDGVTSVGAYAFRMCPNLASVSIAGSVTTLGNAAFAQCEALDHVVIPNGVTRVPDSLFQGCASLTSVVLPDSVTVIGMYAFDGCVSLPDLEFVPDSVTTINYFVFRGCTGLTTVYVPRGISVISRHMFKDCANLTSIAIHSGITKIDINAFDGDTNLTSVFYEGVRAGWDAINISQTGNAPLLNATVYCKTAVIFDSCGGSEVPMQALNYMECAVRPEAPVREGYLFVDWYDNAEYTGEPFDFTAPVFGDTTLYARWATYLQLPAGLAAIEEEAFSGVAAQAVVIPNTVTSIAGNPFAGSGVRYIFGCAGSAAQALANAYPDQFTFIPIDDAWLASH